VIDAAIVGLGRWGRALVESVQGKSARLRFVLGVEPDAAAVREFAAQHRFGFAAGLAQVLPDRSVAAVVLATPHSLHLEQVVAAARAGKHVFCEKPLALTLADAEQMVAACAAAGVTLAVGHNRRWWPAMRELGRLAAAGALGTLLHIEGHNSNENSNAVAGGWRTLPSESPGGGMTGAGLHALDAMVSVAGPVKRVQGRLLRRKAPPAPQDTASALLEFESGVSGLLATVRATPFYWRVHAFGTKGSVEVLGETELVVRMSGKAPERIVLAAADSLRAELEAFADAVEGRAPFPVAPADMLQTVAAFEAVVGALE
jgi:predicted dehydrogenase